MGRTAGSSNKNKDRLLRQVQSEFPNYNGLVELLRLAKNPATSVNEQIQCYKEVNRYLYPTLKAIETTVAIEEVQTPLKIRRIIVNSDSIQRVAP